MSRPQARDTAPSLRYRLLHLDSAPLLPGSPSHLELLGSFAPGSGS